MSIIWILLSLVTFVALLFGMLWMFSHHVKPTHSAPTVLERLKKRGILQETAFIPNPQHLPRG